MSIVHEVLLRNDEDAGLSVRRFFPFARFEREDGVTFWSDDRGAIAFHDSARDGVHLIFVRRCDINDFLRPYAEKAVVVLHEDKLFLAYPSDLIRKAVREGRAGPYAGVIPAALESHYDNANLTALLLPYNRVGDDSHVVALDEAGLAVAVRDYRRRLLRVV